MEMMCASSASASCSAVISEAQRATKVTWKVQKSQSISSLAEDLDKASVITFVFLGVYLIQIDSNSLTIEVTDDLFV